MLDTSEIVSCWYHARVGFDYPRNLRKLNGRSARSSLSCISVYGSIHHLILSALPLRVYFLPLPSLFILCISTTIFPAGLFALHSPLYAIFLYYLPHARRRGAFRETVASHSISLFSHGAHRDARDRSCERGRPGTTKCQNLLDLHASLRPGTRNYLVGLVGDEAQNFELRSFASRTFPAPSSVRFYMYK